MSTLRILPISRLLRLRPTLSSIITAEAGDILIPHLYDWSFDGVDDYIVVGVQPDGSGIPFTVYGWNEITFIDYWMPVLPKANNLWSRTFIIGNPDSALDYPSRYFITNNMNSYTILYHAWNTRRPDGSSMVWYSNFFPYVNTWVQSTTTFNSSRILRVYAYTSIIQTVSVPEDHITVLEWNPNNASNPATYRRYVIGANQLIFGYFTMYAGYSLIFSRALSDTEISTQYNNKVVNANSLRLFLDATFFDGIKYIDLSNYNNHGYPYNGVARIPASSVWMWVIKNLYSGNDVKILIPPMTRYRIETGGWQLNDTWSIQEIYVNPGRIFISIEGL